jgi:thiamine-monophosphate kinase
MIMVERPPAGKADLMHQTEDQLVQAIRKVLSGDAPGVVVGVGDDAAVVEPGRHHGILTTDLLVDGVHFEVERILPHDLGHKAITVNVSDVAAMGGSPRYGVASLGLSPGVEAAWVVELCGGLREAADEYGMAIVGGDTSRADRVTISVAVFGEVAQGAAVTRAGARPGDRLVVTGSLGAAAGGLRLASGSRAQVRGRLSTEAGRAAVAALQRPVARVSEGQELARAGATAMMDLSDGLALDLHRMCRESEVGARVRLDAVPVAPVLLDLAAALDVDPIDLALHGGEDYELLAALPPGAVEGARRRLTERVGTSLHEIGEVTGREGGVIGVGPDGERPLEARGWDHFA